MWKLKKIHQIGELCAAAAVVISLLFVGFEVRQSGLRQMRATTQTVISMYSTQLNTISADSDLACLYWKAQWNLSDLDGTEGIRFSAWMLATNRILEDIYFQQNQQAIEPEIWSAIERSLRVSVAQFPGFRAWYENFGDSLSEDYLRFIQELFEQTELADRSNAIAASC